MGGRSPRSIKVLGDTVRSLRESWGLTQASFGELLGFSREWVSRAERPTVVNLTNKTIERIARVTTSSTAEVADVLQRHHQILMMREIISSGRSDGQLHRFIAGQSVTLPSLRANARPPRPVFDDDNIAPYSEQHIAEPIPTFELCVAAGHWVDVTDNQEAGHHVTEAQNRQGLFRVRVRGDSMTPRFPDDCTCEFRLLRTATGTPDFEAMAAHECYYVQLTDGRATFKCLGSRDRDTLVLLPLNKRKYKRPLTCDVADVVRLAAFEWILSKGK